MKITCKNCNKEFDKINNRIFCSRSCSAIFNNTNKPKRKKEGTCKCCLNKCPSSRTFCSQTCYKNWKLDNPQRVLLPKTNYESVKTYRQKTKLEAIKIKGGSCQICGYNKSIRALTFHHINPEDKAFEISGAHKPWNLILVELQKCILLCSNCHNEWHDGLIPNDIIKNFIK